MQQTVQITRARGVHKALISRLASRVYPDVSSGWPVQMLTHHQVIFPEGQIVALDAGTGQMLGAVLNLIIDSSTTSQSSTYFELIDGGWFRNHNRRTGDWLYEADIMVCPEYRNQGIASAMIAAQMRLAEKLGLRGVRGSIPLTGRRQGCVTDKEPSRAVESQSPANPAIALERKWNASFLNILRNHFDPSQSPHPDALLFERLIQQPLITSQSGKQMVAQQRFPSAVGVSLQPIHAGV